MIFWLPIANTVTNLRLSSSSRLRSSSSFRFFSFSSSLRFLSSSFFRAASSRLCAAASSSSLFVSWKETSTCRIQDLTAVVMKSPIFWDIMLCGLLKVNWRFKETELYLLHASCYFLPWLILWPWRWMCHAPPKCWLTFNGPHNFISQKKKTLQNNYSLCLNINYTFLCWSVTHQHFSSRIEASHSIMLLNVEGGNIKHFLISLCDRLDPFPPPTKRLLSHLLLTYFLPISWPFITWKSHKKT